MNESQTMSKTRIESFSDCVFSVVMTLLIFSFHIPKLTDTDFNQELYSKLFALYPKYLSYIMSFTLVGMFWIAHHTLFYNLKHSTNALLWINNFFLLFLAFLPFPTEVMGTYPNTESAVVFFGIEMILTSLSFALLRYYCFFVGKLTNEAMSEKYMRYSMIKNIGGIIFYIIAIAVSVYSSEITLTMYVLIPFLYFIPISGNVKNRVRKGNQERDKELTKLIRIK